MMGTIRYIEDELMFDPSWPTDFCQFNYHVDYDELAVFLITYAERQFDEKRQTLNVGSSVIPAYDNDTGAYTPFTYDQGRLPSVLGNGRLKQMFNRAHQRDGPQPPLLFDFFRFRQFRHRCRPDRPYVLTHQRIIDWDDVLDKAVKNLYRKYLVLSPEFTVNLSDAESVSDDPQPENLLPEVKFYDAAPQPAPQPEDTLPEVIFYDVVTGDDGRTTYTQWKE